jgi:hypothetical protein
LAQVALLKASLLDHGTIKKNYARNHISHFVAPDVAGSVADLAVQPWLELLPKQRAWPGAGYSRRSALVGTHLNSTQTLTIHL